MIRKLILLGLCACLLLVASPTPVIAQDSPKAVSPTDEADKGQAEKAQKQEQDKGDQEQKKQDQSDQNSSGETPQGSKKDPAPDGAAKPDAAGDGKQGSDPQEKPEADQDKPDQEEDGTQAERPLRSFFGGMAQDPDRERSKRAKEMVSLVKPLVVSVEASTVKILNGSRTISLGTVVDRSGLILTKASELQGELNCTLADGRKSKAVVVGVHPDTDLALLKVELPDLQPIHWGSDPAPAVGQWVVSPTFGEIQIGVVGVNARKIPPSTPFLGIGPSMSSTEEVVGAKIYSVQPNTPADEVDLMVGDIITQIDEVEIKNWDDLRKTLGQYDPKDEVTLTVQRGQEVLKIKVALGDREKLQGNLFPQQDRSAMQNNMGSRPSQRRKDFPMAFQHDLGLNKTTCGGPVVNLNGQVVGINIARAGRVDSLALPVNTVLPVLEILKSGELAPAKVNQARLVELDKELEEVTTKLEAIPATGAIQSKLQIEKARKEELDRAKAELNKALEELENRIKVVDLKKENFEKELKSITNERNALDRKKFGLERERKNLSTGVR